jgi:hypothetical protein
MYFITVSEMLGTKGEEIAQKVAKGMNYAYYGEAELLKFAEEMGFLTDVKKLDEKGPPLLERLFSEKPKVYLDRLQSVIFEVAKRGDALFFGKGSQRGGRVSGGSAGSAPGRRRVYQGDGHRRLGKAR